MENQLDEIIITHLPREVTKLVIRGNMPLLKAWRIYLGISLRDAAEKSGLDTDFFAGMENKENMFSEELKKIAQTLGVDVDLLVDIDPIKDQPDIYC